MSMDSKYLAGSGKSTQENPPKVCDIDNYHQRLLRGVVKNLHDGIVSINSEGIVLSVNTAVENMTGYSAEELVGKNVNILMADNIANSHQMYVQKVVEKADLNVTGMKRCMQVYRKDGSFLLAEIAISKMLLDDDIVFIGCIYDVTDQIEQEKIIWELGLYLEKMVIL